MFRMNCPDRSLCQCRHRWIRSLKMNLIPSMPSWPWVENQTSLGALDKIEKWTFGWSTLRPQVSIFRIHHQYKASGLARPSSRVWFHQKLNGTESQRTPWKVSCDRAIRSSGFSGSVQWILLEISWNDRLNACKCWVPSLKLTLSLKTGGLETIFLLGRPIFRCYVGFREAIPGICWSPALGFGGFKELSQERSYTRSVKATKNSSKVYKYCSKHCELDNFDCPNLSPIRFVSWSTRSCENNISSFAIDCLSNCWFVLYHFYPCVGRGSKMSTTFQLDVSTSTYCSRSTPTPHAPFTVCYSTYCTCVYKCIGRWYFIHGAYGQVVWGMNMRTQWFCFLLPRKPTWLAGKSTIWRCISYWKWGFSNVILAFRGVIFHGKFGGSTTLATPRTGFIDTARLIQVVKDKVFDVC